MSARQISEMPDWRIIVMADVDPEEPRPHMRCTRCGERMVTVWPVCALSHVMAMRGFLRAHTKCKP